MNIAGWFVLGLLIFGVVFLFWMMLIDHIKIKKQLKLHEDMEYTLHNMNIWMYYDRVLGEEFNPFTCDKAFIRIFESRDGYTKFEKQVFSQSYNKADKHEHGNRHNKVGFYIRFHALTPPTGLLAVHLLM